MRSRLMSGIAAIALTACTVVATAAPASAAPWGWHHGWHGGWGGAVAAGVIGGAVAAATSPLWAPGYYDYYPGYAYEPYGYTVAPGPMAGGTTPRTASSASARTIRQPERIWALTGNIIPARKPRQPPPAPSKRGAARPRWGIESRL